MAELKAGLKLNSAVCDAQIMVIKPGGSPALSCGGVPMQAGDATTAGAAPDAGHMAGCQIGKRYVNEDQSVEVLCVKAGDGSLAADGAALTMKDAKKLPSSD